ncbi:MAG TPA: hypothetical protein VGU63_14790, partial [Candidatus Acidoferrales bacterium]|nr:hypothetical protein [Candidatus Acidoferrales bacterium]
MVCKISKGIHFRVRFRVGLALSIMAAIATTVAAVTLPNLFPFRDSSGLMETFNATGKFQENGPFFQSLGTNGRTCATCHVVGNAMGLSAASAESVYERTNGHDPLFAKVDGAVCPTTTAGNALNFDLVRHYGLFRIAIQLPPAANTQFKITAVH